jgi:hypothetical protein
MDINGNSKDDDTIAELKDWLFERVQDDCDVVVDDLQEEFAAFYEDLESKAGDKVCQGSKEYKTNQKYLATSLAELMTPEGKAKIKVKKDKQKITDGIRNCWYGGTKNSEDYPHGEGMFAYENKDVFKGKFDNGVLDREGKLILSSKAGIHIDGKWKDGLMEGEMKIQVKLRDFKGCVSMWENCSDMNLLVADGI